jgi:deoxyadenosine/deoxycytidine kinase
MSSESSSSVAKIITIEGNIGSGKSTMINRLRTTYDNVVVIDEPVDQWLSMKDENGKSLLELFYGDMNRWSYTFQNSAFITRYLNAYEAIQKHKNTPNTVFISERGILTDRYVFASMLKDNNNLSSIEWQLYTKWFDHFQTLIKIQGIVYIDTPSEVCSERIKKRNREGENNIPLEYLKSLEDYHLKWINNTDLPVLRVSSNASEAQKIVDFAVNV